MVVAKLPVIPEYITVHLGRPDEYGQNVQVPFVDYIKNVASSEIYPTWPENAIRANVYAQISFALNRIYTEWYRTKGYNFDITNSTQFDQAYVHQREIFQNVGEIVDEIFNDYVVKQGSVEPYATRYCNGTTVFCEGLSQWGTVTDAKNGLVPYAILQKYYGANINIVENAPIEEILESYPGVALRLGAGGNEVKEIQLQLNRIGKNYPAITRIPQEDGAFGVDTENAVKAFQKIFGLREDGVVGRATWYKVKNVYNGVKRLGELSSEGVMLEEVIPAFPRQLERGMKGIGVKVIQYYLAVIGYFNNSLPVVQTDGIFGKETESGVKAFQAWYGLTEDGIVGRETWNKMLEVYSGTLATLPEDFLVGEYRVYPGAILKRGSTNGNVSYIQRVLAFLSGYYPEIPKPGVDGYFGESTQAAVKGFQKYFDIPQTGYVAAFTWGKIVSEYKKIKEGV